MKNKKISIITVCFNSSKTILETIKSVNHQSYCNIEHVFIDGCSSDSTIDIINSYSKVSKIIISEKDDGIYDAMNTGVEVSTGDFIMFLNSDDILHSNITIKNIMDELERYSLDAVYGDILFFKDSPEKPKRIWRSCEYNANNVKKGFHPPHPGLTVSRKFFDKVGAFNCSYKIVGDYDFMLRLFAFSNLKIKYLNSIIVDMRLGGVSTTINGVIISFNEFLSVLKSNNYSNIDIIRILLHRYLLKIKQNIIK
jgi:glycosyltransferase